jgi:16S rRNA processing protein RimM
MKHENKPLEEQVKKQTGSPTKGEPIYLAVGKLRRPHGIMGEMLMEVWTDFPERLKKGKKVFVGDDHSIYEIDQIRSADKMVLVHFKGYNTSQDIDQLRNALMYVRADDLPALPEGEYYFHQLIGLNVVDESGQPVGILSEIMETGANDVYVIITPAGEEALLPAIDEVIRKVDLEQGRLIVNLPEWYSSK